jgi:hypothetical protein
MSAYVPTSMLGTGPRRVCALMICQWYERAPEAQVSVRVALLGRLE